FTVVLVYRAAHSFPTRRSSDLNKGIPLVLGGDHSIAVGTVAGVSESFRREGKKIGLMWFDAHADFNTPEISPSGNVHGMPMAAIDRKSTRLNSSHGSISYAVFG